MIRLRRNMAVLAAILVLIFGICSAQHTSFGGRGFSRTSGGFRSSGFGTGGSVSSFGPVSSVSSFGPASSGAQSGFRSQRMVRLVSGGLTGSSFPQRTSLLSGSDITQPRTVSIQRSSPRIISSRSQQFQPDSIARQPITHQTARTVQLAPVRTAPVAQPAPQPAPVAPAPQQVHAAPAPPPPAPVAPAAPVVAPAVPAMAHMPGAHMGMMSPMGMMNPMMSPMMNPMMSPMMSPMGMGMGMGMGMMNPMGGMMSYDTMEDLYLDPDRPDRVAMAAPIGMAAPMAMAPRAVAMPAQPVAAAAGATPGISQAAIASALQTALSRMGQRQTAVTG